MNIVVTLNKAYLFPLKVMLKSLFDNCSSNLDIYIIYSDISKPEIDKLSEYVAKHGHALHPLKIESDTFSDAPVNSYYSKEMYYRLMAHEILPGHVGKALYLDPDILILNPVEPLYSIDLGNYFYAAAAHLKPMINYINKIRLKTESNKYYNSGVLLINVELLRKEADISQLHNYIKKHAGELILPDQDVLNGLYWNRILPLNEYLYNYDARRYRSYFISSKGMVNIDFIIKNTVILHFCGKHKPWHKNYPYRFGILYKHYEKMAERAYTS
ncbi:MAG: glycosyltransferase family 8 protein [Clostridiaceae bacterium]|nr:glycosyltransferase family 8 protein [Clostridiaceae bacterium]